MLKSKNAFIRIFYIFALYGAVMLLVLAERAGAAANPTVITTQSTYLDNLSVQAAKKEKSTCLLVYNSKDAESLLQLEQWRIILDAMDAPYDELDTAKSGVSANGYSTVIITMPGLRSMSDDVERLCDWVKSGGSVLFSATLENQPVTNVLMQRLGVVETDFSYITPEKIKLDDTLIGGGNSFAIENAFPSSMAVRLDKSCRVHISTDADDPMPILWDTDYGDGRFVVMNLGFSNEATRGLYAAAYTFACKTCAYPVINSSTFYLDDFPSPVPAGNGEYIEKEFGRSISSFYTNVWWTDISALAKKYGIKYTGAFIENYSDNIEPPFYRNSDTGRFNFFGSELLKIGGELSLHGYNHMPLVTDSFDYNGEENYRKWHSTEDMQAALKEAYSLETELFPESRVCVYIPPSNILSDEGREAITTSLPQIRAIASLYFKTGCGYAQSFTVADDGIIEMPRIVSGAELTDYMRLALVSELNFRYVNSHFIHPDDLLDEDRGATSGWTYLRGKYEEYIEFLENEAPALRKQTGSEEMGAVQRYYYAEVSQSVDDEHMYIGITNFYDETYLLVRIEGGKPKSVDGGDLTKVADGLYLLHATSAHVTINL